MSQSVGDMVIDTGDAYQGIIPVDTRQSYDQQPGFLTQDPGKSQSFTQDECGRKLWIFYLNNWNYQSLYIFCYIYC